MVWFRRNESFCSGRSGTVAGDVNETAAAFGRDNPLKAQWSLVDSWLDFATGRRCATAGWLAGDGVAGADGHS